MKYIVIVIVTLMMGVKQSNAQGPVRPYNNSIYSVTEMKNFALGKSDTAKAFARFILNKCQRSLDLNGYKTKLELENLPWLFDSCISIEEVSLKKGTFENSLWDRSKKDLKFFTSNADYEGPAGVFKYGRCYDELWKGNCANGLNVPKTKSTPPVIVEKPTAPKVEPPVIECENHLLIMIYRKVDQNGTVVSESRDTTGTETKGCKNSYKTSVKRDTIPPQKEPDDYEVEEKVDGTTTINNYTTNIYGAQQGGPRRVPHPVYRERRSGFQIFLGYNGGGSSTSITPTRRVTMGQPVGNTRRVTMGRPVGNNRRINMGQGTGG